MAKLISNLEIHIIYLILALKWVSIMISSPITDTTAYASCITKLFFNMSRIIFRLFILFLSRAVILEPAYGSSNPK